MSGIKTKNIFTKTKIKRLTVGNLLIKSLSFTKKGMNDYNPLKSEPLILLSSRQDFPFTCNLYFYLKH